MVESEETFHLACFTSLSRTHDDGNGKDDEEDHPGEPDELEERRGWEGLSQGRVREKRKDAKAHEGMEVAVVQQPLACSLHEHAPGEGDHAHHVRGGQSGSGCCSGLRKQAETPVGVERLGDAAGGGGGGGRGD